jgi:serine/threonine-protein phosphatase 4 regulatory subunit 1
VQKAAYQVLGLFIATFYNPHSAYASEDEKEDSDILADTSPIPLVDSDSPEKLSVNDKQDKEKISSSPLEHEASEVETLNATDETNVDWRGKIDKADSAAAASDSFSSFLYWQTPLPDISFELKLRENQVSVVSKANDEGEEVTTSYVSVENSFDDGHQLADGSFLSCVKSSEAYADQARAVFSESEVDINFYQVAGHSWDYSSVGDVDSLVLKQDVVPEELLEHYVSMIETSQAQFIDPDLPLHCAYSFPGVAMTLGKEHWSCIKPIYGILCSHMQVSQYLQ